MTTYQYKILPILESQQLEKDLNELGRQGYRVLTIILHPPDSCPSLLLVKSITDWRRASQLRSE